METRHIDSKDAAKLLSVPDKRDRLYFAISLYAGRRFNENITIKWGWLFDESGPKIWVSKQKRYMYFPKSEALVQAIRDCYEGQDFDEFVFQGRRGVIPGSPMTNTGINKMIKFWFSELGIESRKATSHCLRKTFARNYYEQNGRDHESLLWLMKYLGHRDVSTTLRYIGIEEEVQAAKVNNITYG